MKKFYFVLLIIFISLIYSGKLLSQCYNCESLWMQDPKSPWKRTQGSIYDVSMIVKPVGKFFQVDVYMSYKSDPNYYNNVTDTFEVQHYFTLPDNVSFTDSWLWVDTTIMKADILERYSAFNIYEGIVNRRQDPSVLYKNSSGGYEFRIFPLPAKKFRKVKLSMMIPANENDGFYLPLSMFRYSKPTPEIQVLVYGDDTDKIPVLSNGAVFEAKVHATLGAYKLAKIPSTQVQTQAGIALSMVTETAPVSIAYGTEENQTGEGYYQLTFDPSTLLGVDTLNRRSLVFLIDHHSQTTLYNKTEVLAAARQMIKRVVRPNDRFRILYNHFSIKEVSPTWINGSEVDLESIFAGIQLGSASLLTSGLYEAYNYVLDEEDGQVIVISSDASKYQQLEAQQLKNELVDELGELRPTFILDYAAYNTHYHSTYYNGKYYYGNEVFYKNIIEQHKRSLLYLGQL
ncbi:MAG: hypothetical protein IPN29_17770 [Saprospiraceae bacterium]|nr:hypothetical protein [Saprospiraceae bacterium]